MKKLLCILVNITLVLGFAACSGADNPQSQADSAPADSVAQENSTNSGSAEKITFWHWWSGHEEEYLKTVAQAYSEQSGVQVDLLQVKDFATILTAISGGTPPDMIMVTNKSQVYELASSGATQALDTWIERDGIDTGVFLDSALGGYIVGDELHALPFLGFNDGLIWNKAMFEEAGLDPEQPPQSAEEMVEFAKKLTKVDDSGKITQLGFIPNWPFDHMAGANASYIKIFDGEIYDAAAGRYTLDNAGIVKVLEWERSFYEGLDPQAVANFVKSAGAYLTTDDPFEAGQVAMAIDGCWSVRFVGDNVPDLQFGAAPVPVRKDNTTWKGLNTIDFNPHMIPVGSPNPDAAWEFMKHLILDGTVVANFADASANLSHLKELPADYTSELFENPLYQVFVQASNTPACYSVPVIPRYSEFETKMLTIQERILLEPDADIPVLLAQANEELNAG